MRTSQQSLTHHENVPRPQKGGVQHARTHAPLSSAETAAVISSSVEVLGMRMTRLFMPHEIAAFSFLATYFSESGLLPTCEAATVVG